MAKSFTTGAVMEPRVRTQIADDGTRVLLRTGAGTLIAGIVAAILTIAVFGGIGIHGPHTNGGWLSLMVAMMCMPFGLMLFGLGFAKWLRNRRLGRQSPR